MEQPDAIIFDFDGTLVDLDGFIEKYTSDFIVGNNLTTTLHLKDFYKEINSGTSSLEPSLIDKFKQNWKERMVNEIPLIAGVAETIKSLKERGVRLGIVSTGYVERLTRILEAKGMSGYFDVLIGKEDVANQKPDPEGILKALQRLGTSPEKALYIGDNQVDVVAGKAAGVKTAFLAINRPYAEQIKPWLEENKPDYIVEKLEDLLNISK